jgi:hypothetical protein
MPRKNTPEKQRNSRCVSYPVPGPTKKMCGYLFGTFMLIFLKKDMIWETL